MRIVIASACEFPGGIGGAPRFAQMQAKGMASLGHDVCVVVTHGTWDGENRIQMEDYQAVRFGTRISNLRGIRRKFAPLATHLRFLTYLLGQTLLRRYSVLLLNGPVVDFALVAPLARLLGREVLYVQADMLPFSKKMSMPARLKKMVSWCVDIFLAKMASRLILLGTTELLDFYKRMAPRTPQVRIWAPTDTTAFAAGDGESARRKYEIGERKLVLYCGTVDTLEGCHVLVEAMKTVKSRHPDSMLVFAGVLWPEDRVLGSALDFHAMVRDAELENDVLFTGHVSSGDIIDLLKAADVLVMPKIDHLLNRVAMPIKIAEYLASGRPIVSSRICELDMCLRDSEDVLFCEPGNPKELAECISRVLSDPELSKKLSRNAVIVAKSMFDCSVIARLALDGDHSLNCAHTRSEALR